MNVQRSQAYIVISPEEMDKNPKEAIRKLNEAYQQLFRIATDIQSRLLEYERILYGDRNARNSA